MMAQPTESGERLDPAYKRRADRDWPARGRVLREPEVRPVLMVQVDNLIPIVLNCEKSVIRGIRGMGALSGFMERW